MSIDNSTTLLGTGPATQLIRCYLPGLGSTSILSKELVTASEVAFALGGSAARSSDANGNHLSCSATTDYAVITESVSPVPSTGFTAILIWEPGTATPDAWTTLFQLHSFSGNFGSAFQYSNSGNVGIQVSSDIDQATGAIAMLGTSFQGLVLSFDTATDTAKLFIAGQASPLSLTTFPSALQSSIDFVHLFHTNNGDIGYTGKIYAFALSDDVISDADCQDIADDPVATLFTGGGGGGGGFQAAWARNSNIIIGGSHR
jgi:hypothetical protein